MQPLLPHSTYLSCKFLMQHEGKDHVTFTYEKEEVTYFLEWEY